MVFHVCGVNNGTCVCPIGQYFNSGGKCVYLNSTVVSNSKDYFDPPVPTLVDFQLNPKDATEILVATGIILAVWIVGTTAIRFMPLRGVWFKLRRFVRWTDFIYSKRHWMDEQKCQVRRKTEVGGVASVGATVFILGFVVSALYQYFTFQPYSIQSIYPTTGPTIGTYNNNIDLNVTIVSNMKCAQLQSVEFAAGQKPYAQTLAYGTSFTSLGSALVPCLDTPSGPQVRVFCTQCVTSRDEYDFTWTFKDRPDLGLVAAAVGFEYAARITTSGDPHMSSVTQGASVASLDDKSSVTIRGPSPSSLHLRFVPRIFRERGKEDVQLIEVFFHEFLLGDNVNASAPAATAASQNPLQASLQNSSIMVLKLSTHILSSYEVFSEVQHNKGVVVLLANIAGLYKLGVLLFFLAMNMVERYFPGVRYDEKLLDRLWRKRQAQAHWRKLRIAVKYGMLHSLATGGQEAAPEARRLMTRRMSMRAPLASAAGAAQEGRAAAAGWSSWTASLLAWVPWLRRGNALPRGHLRTYKSSGRTEALAREEVAAMDPAAARAAHKESTAGAVASAPSASSSRPRTGGPAAESQQKDGALGGSSGHGGKRTYLERRETLVLKPPAPKPRYKYEDERKGSLSEHTGIVVRQYRRPSWVPDYTDLPSVPEIPPRIARHLERLKESARKKAAGKDTQTPTSAAAQAAEHLPPPDPVELYNFLAAMDEYQARLRYDFLLAQSMVENILQRFRPHSDL